MARKTFYEPHARGFEREIKKRLGYWNKLRAELGAERQAGDSESA